MIINVGSRTRDAELIEGVWDHGLTTRPINNLLHNLKQREEHLVQNKIVPKVVVCGAGAAGTELSFGYKKRWSKLFG